LAGTLLFNALKEAIDEEMANDVNVCVMGEDVGQYGGSYKVTKDLYEKYGIEYTINSLDGVYAFILIDSDINKIYSNPILSLLTLTNSESHNFTSESLFKNASNTWNNNDYIKLKRWLENKGLPATNAYFADASGLSRNNKITTKLVVLFLDKMRYFKDFKAFQSTLSITGVRGTLAKRFVNSELSWKFFGKTGTLSNVFALSGFLYKNEKPIIISIIQNSNNINKEKAFKLLRDVYYLKSCK